MPPSAAAARDLQFNWEGKDKNGNKIRGKILAVNENQARADLRRQNIIPTKVSKHRNLFGGGGRISPMDIAVFSRQLSTMLAAGIPLVQSFEIVGVGHEKPAMQKLILEISGLMQLPRIVPVQDARPAPRTDCMVGERMWQRYYDGVIRP